MSAVAAAVAGGLISSAGQIYANQQNIAANEARFGEQTELANSAHQREVLDLQKAGLNPILSASGSGSSVPQLSSASVGSVTDSLGEGVSAAGRLAALDIPLKESQVLLNSAQAQNLAHDGVLKKVQADAVRKGMETLGNSAGTVESVSKSFGDWLGDKLGQIYQGTLDDHDRVKQQVSSQPRQVRHWQKAAPVVPSLPKPAPGRVRPSYVPLSSRKYVPLSERRKR